MTQIIQHLSSTQINAAQLCQQTEERIHIIHEQRNNYHNHSTTLLNELKKLDARVKELYQKLQEQPPVYATFDSPLLTPSSPLSASSATPSTPRSEDSAEALKLFQHLSQAQHHVETLSNSMEERVNTAKTECEKFHQLFLKLIDLVKSRNVEIKQLEARVQILLPPPAPAAASPTPKTEASDADEEALQALERDIKNINISYITDTEERNKVLQNLMFFFYEEEMKGEVSDVNDPPTALQVAARKAISVIYAMGPSTPQITPQITEQDLIRSFLSSKKRNFNTKIKTQANEKTDTESLTGINAIVGQSLKFFAHFYFKLKTEKGSKNEAPKSYSDFHFTTIPFLSGELFLIERRLKKAEELYKDQLRKNPSESKKIKEQLTAVEKKLQNIQRIKGSFKKLLEKCRVSPHRTSVV